MNPKVNFFALWAIRIAKQMWNTLSKKTVEGMIISTRTLRLKGKSKNAQKKLRHIFMHKFS